jgi:hypothetical protein
MMEEGAVARVVIGASISSPTRGSLVSDATRSDRTVQWHRLDEEIEDCKRARREGAS